MIRCQTLKFVWIWLILPFQIFAQSYELKEYTRVDGFPNASVSSINQDIQEYLWVGTSKGLFRFNGYEFIRYSTEDGLNNDFIKSVSTNGVGDLFIGSNEGLNTFNLRKGFKESIRSYLEDKIVIDALSQDSSLIILSNSGVFKLKANIQAVDSFLRVKQGLNVEGQVIIITDAGLHQYDNNSDTVKLIWNAEGLSINSICRYLDGYLLATDNNITKLTPSGTGEYENEILRADLAATQLFRDSKERIWAVSYEGLYQLEEDVWIKNQSPELNQKCNHIYEDKNGNIWIGTDKSLIRWTDLKFNNYRSNSELLNQQITALEISDNGDQWIGDSEGRLWKGKRETGFIRQGTPVLFEQKTVQKIFIDSESTVWVSSVLNGVFRYENDDLIKVSDPNGSLNRFVFDIEENDAGIWFGGPRGLVNLYNGNYTYFGIPDQSSAPFVKDIHTSVNGDIWVILNQGIGYVKEGSIILLDTLKELEFTSLTSDKHNDFYLGTEDEGVIKFQLKPSFNIIDTFDQGQGLRSNNVLSIHVDTEGDLWVGTDKGVSRINQDQRIENFYFRSDEVKSRCYPNSISEGNGFLHFGTYNGVMRISKSESDKSSGLLPTYVKSYSYLNKGVDDQKVRIGVKEFGLPSKLSLPYDANFLNFTFESIDLSAADLLEYRIKLIGLEVDFNLIGSNRDFTYANLDPGSYELQVSSRSTNTEWSENASFSFTIRPPYWETWWFRISLLILFIGTAVSFANYRINRIRQEAAEKAELNNKISEFRLVALRSQMNPHFIFNALYSIQHFITTNEKEEALNYMAKFASLIRLILENSGKNSISIEGEVNMLKLYLDLERLRFDQKFDYEFEIDEDDDLEELKIPYLLLQPFIENAIIHGIRNKEGNGRILIKISEHETGFIKCIVEDNGIGREAAAKLKNISPIKSKSLGIEVNRERLGILNPDQIKDTSINIVDLKNDENLPDGTRVEIIVPIMNET